MPECLGYVRRERFREGPVLEAYIAAHMHGIAMTDLSFTAVSGSCLPDLWRCPVSHSVRHAVLSR